MAQPNLRNYYLEGAGGRASTMEDAKKRASNFISLYRPESNAAAMNENLKTVRTANAGLAGLFNTASATYDALIKRGRAADAHALKRATERFNNVGSELGVNKAARARAITEMTNALNAASRKAESQVIAQKVAQQADILGKMAQVDAQSWNQEFKKAQFGEQQFMNRMGLRTPVMPQPKKTEAKRYVGVTDGNGRPLKGSTSDTRKFTTSTKLSAPRSTAQKAPVINITQPSQPTERRSFMPRLSFGSRGSNAGTISPVMQDLLIQGRAQQAGFRAADIAEGNVGARGIYSTVDPADAASQAQTGAQQAVSLGRTTFGARPTQPSPIVVKPATGGVPSPSNQIQAGGGGGVVSGPSGGYYNDFSPTMPQINGVQTQGQYQYANTPQGGVMQRSPGSVINIMRDPKTGRWSIKGSGR